MDKILECPICIEVMSIPTTQCCEGHTMCHICKSINNKTTCPLCVGPFPKEPKRNYLVEDMITKYKNNEFKLPCYFKSKGCKFELTFADKDNHENECKFRKFFCEGKIFAKWKCDWLGEIGEIHKHFKDYHNNSTWMEYRTEANLKINFENEHKDLQIISFHNGQNYFYYKHKVDVVKQKVYWAFQMIGTKTCARNYFYEFEVYQGPIRKFKVTEICQNDRTNAEEIFESERCVCMSFASVKSFLNEEGELSFKFRIMKKHVVNKN